MCGPTERHRSERSGDKKSIPRLELPRTVRLPVERTYPTGARQLGKLNWARLCKTRGTFRAVRREGADMAVGVSLLHTEQRRRRMTRARSPHGNEAQAFYRARNQFAVERPRYEDGNLEVTKPMRRDDQRAVPEREDRRPGKAVPNRCARCSYIAIP